MRKKGDKGKIRDGWGTSHGSSYVPWITVREFSSAGRVHRVLNWKNGRVCQLFSDLEYYYWLLLMWEDEIIDVREQYPLLPLEQTQIIADKLGKIHPPLNCKDKTIMTTDFLITKMDNMGRYYDIARAVKTTGDLNDSRVQDKLLIEKEFWNIKGIEWKIVTENSINMVKAKNIEFVMEGFYLSADYGNNINKYKYLIANKKVLVNMDEPLNINSLDFY